MDISQIGVHQANDLSDLSSNVEEISEVDEQLCETVRISIKNLLKGLPPVNAKCNIFRVPKPLRKKYSTAYDPELISIGPFHHHSREDLKFTEQYKLQGLMNFLRRMNFKMETSEGTVKNASSEDILKTKSPMNLSEDIEKIASLEDILKTKSLKVLLEKTHTWVKKARSCYEEPINMRDHDFLNMMLVDGCFIVEILILNYGLPIGFPPMKTNVDLSFYKGKITDIFTDLIKLENQVPFFVLEGLYDLIPKYGSSISFKDLTYKALPIGWVRNYELSDEVLQRKSPKHFVDFLSFYFDPNMSPDIQKKDEENSKVLSLRFFCLLLRRCRQKLSEEIGNVMNMLLTFFCFLSRCRKHNDEEKKLIPPSITELCEAGVIIKKAENAKSVMNISFKNGVLEIPPLNIDDDFETIMRNLIAIEQFHTDNMTMYVTQYVLFMDYLISTKNDVNLLVKAGIIINDIGGSDKEVSELFNNLCKFVTISRSECYNNISKALHEHCNGCWNKSKASLKHNYFNTPWAVISFLAATFLILLTLLQTIFSAISTF